MASNPREKMMAKESKEELIENRKKKVRFRVDLAEEKAAEDLQKQMIKEVTRKIQIEDLIEKKEKIERIKMNLIKNQVVEMKIKKEADQKKRLIIQELKKKGKKIEFVLLAKDTLKKMRRKMNQKPLEEMILVCKFYFCFIFYLQINTKFQLQS